MPMRNIHMHYVKLIFTLMLAVLVGACGESTAPSSSKNEAASTTEQSFVESKKRADSGDADAQANLGLLYGKGEGVPQDFAQARQWYEKAATQGNGQAQANLGLLYAKGEGVPQDYAQARQWYEKAATQGNAQAQVNLGEMYARSEGVPQDYDKAMEWFQKAAAQGHARAQVDLGEMYADGWGVPKDAAKAAEWYQKAAAQGDAEGQLRLGRMYATGEGVPKDAAKAVEWYQKAAVQGDEAGQFSLGLSYLIGDGVPEDSVLAYAWLNLSAAQGDENAKGVRDIVIPKRSQFSSAQRAEAERLSSNWKPGQVLRRESESGSAADNTAPSGGALTKKGTGTAFIVSTEGHAVTNYHVVANCKEVRVQGRSDLVQLVTRDEVSDLALLKLPGETRAIATLSPKPAALRQGQDIVVLGFPLDSVLSSGGNLTPGVVSAITGLGNNSNQIQITAPIQPGSSGSPVMNKKGQVVGVVSMKLSDAAMAKHTGTLPQNVNFAISGQTLNAFLDAHKVPHKTGWSFLSWEKSLADLGDEARTWTTVVECWK